MQSFALNYCFAGFLVEISSSLKQKKTSDGRRSKPINQFIALGETLVQGTLFILSIVSLSCLTGDRVCAPVIPGTSAKPRNAMVQSRNARHEKARRVVDIEKSC